MFLGWPLLRGMRWCGSAGGADGRFREEAHCIGKCIRFLTLIHSTVICPSKAWLYAFCCVSLAIPSLQVLIWELQLGRLLQNVHNL